MDAEAGELDAVDEADEGDVVGGVDAAVQGSVVGDGVARIVELGVVDVSRIADVDQVCLSVGTSMVSHGLRPKVTALRAYL